MSLECHGKLDTAVSSENDVKCFTDICIQSIDFTSMIHTINYVHLCMYLLID